MTGKRKVTVSVTVAFEDMMMESTDDALNIIKGVLLTAGQQCREEIEQALADAGAREVNIRMMAF